MKWIFLFCLFFSSLAIADELSLAQPLKNPILLVHGATMGGGRLIVGPFDLGEYFLHVPELLRSSKTEVSTVDLPSDATIEECAMVLKSFLEKNMAGKKVNIIAHSLGGLDARYLVSVLHSNQVVSITTIGSPHRGTPLADWGFKQVNERGSWYYTFRILGYDLVGRRFLKELTTEFMAKQFNPRVPDRSDIKYFSVVTTGEMFTRTMSPLLYPTYYWIRSMQGQMAEEPNDGIVPLSSQSWGKEIARLNLDHLSQMGHDSFRFFSLEQESIKLYSLIYKELQSSGL